MVPIGPYTSSWTSKDFYLVSTIRSRDVIYAVVANGEQTNEATVITPSKREALAWLKDNGFSLRLLPKEQQP